MTRIVLHSDMNAFYASVEAMLDPSLRGKAVAVCGSTETRHGIVLAKSQPAKQAGVKTGMAVWEARQLCRGLLVVPPQYEQYLKYSRLARAVCERYTDLVEPFGMDENFLDVTASTSLFGGGEAIAEEIRRTVRSELGLTVSVGVSFNKVFAKLGSDLKKPDAVTCIPPERYREIVWPLRSSEMIFVGRSTERRLDRYGIHTIGDIARADPQFLCSLLGIGGYSLWAAANGEDHGPVARKDAVSPIKSIGHGITCIADLENEEEVWRVILELSQDVGHRLRLHGLRASGVQIGLRDNNLLDRQCQKKLPVLTQDPLDIALAARELYRRSPKNGKIRAVTVRAIGLVPQDQPEQIAMGTDPVRADRRERLFGAVDDLRNRFGAHSVEPAALLQDLKMPAYRDHGLIMPGCMNR